jgi:hypothetical protein
MEFFNHLSARTSCALRPKWLTFLVTNCPINGGRSQLSAKRDSQGRYLRLLKLNLAATSSKETGPANQLFVNGNDSVWVNDTFGRFYIALEKIAGSNALLYSQKIELFVQLFAVCAILAIAILGAIKIAPRIHVSNAAVYVFGTLFLLGSNLWTYFSRELLRVRASRFPVIGFKSNTFEKYVFVVISFASFAIVTWFIERILTSIADFH